MRENGREHQVFFARFSPWNWTVCWAVPKNTITGQMEKMLVGMFFILAGTFVLMGLVLTYFMTVMVKPVTALTDVANSIAEGNVPHFVETGRQDEVGTLTRAFVRM